MHIKQTGVDKLMFGTVRLREVRHKYTYTVHWQSIDRQWYEVCELKHGRIYMSAYLSICESVYLYVKKIYSPWPVTYISYVTALA